MEWDCRIYCDIKPIYKRTISKILLILIVATIIHPVVSIYVECDTIQEGKQCWCSLGESNAWTIDCPNELLESYPISLKVSSLNSEEAVLGVKCNTEVSEFKWDLIGGVDLSQHKIAAKIIKIEIQFCPMINDGLKGFLNRVNISAEQIKKFSFVSFRQISSIPESFLSQLSHLETLNLRANRLQEVPNLSTLKNLKELNLRDNSIEHIPSNTFLGNQNLENVRLSANKISQLEPNTFPISIKYLDLTANKISKLPNLSMLTKLNILVLNNNPLDNIDADCFDNLPELQDLFLNSALLKTFPSFHNVPQLTNLSMNFLNYVPTFGTKPIKLPPLIFDKPLELKDLPSLVRFEASYSRLTALPVVANLPKIISIDLSRNQIQELTSDFFMQLSSVTSMNLGGNMIKDLIEIKSPRLEKLNLSKNRIGSISKVAFRHLGRLLELDLHQNMINHVDFQAFASLSGLRDLDLSYNNISFSNSPYANFKSTDGLGDPSMMSPLQYCVGLRKLNFSHNAIDKIFDDWKNVQTMLSSLDLSYNKLQYINSDHINFISSQNLQLNLSSNDISFINLHQYEIYLDSKPSSIDIYLDRNPLNCNCSAYDIKSFSIKSYRFHYENLRCHSPQNLLNLKLSDVPSASLRCLIGKDNGCPNGKCDCWERPVDRTIFIDCSKRELTNDELPRSSWNFGKWFRRWSLEFNFSGNHLSEISDDYLRQLPNNTQVVDLSGNNLTSISFLNSLKGEQKMNFSLGNNPFPCDSCSDFVFLWATHSQLISDNDIVTCIRKDANDVKEKYTVDSVPVLVDTCQPSLTSEIRILIIAVTILTGLCVILIFFMVRYSWVLKAFLYSQGWGCCLFWDNDLDEDDGEKLYDAFVSYSHKDEEWVLEELVDRLEEKEGFKLCLHFRDWIPGDWIPDQIVRSVDQSKRTVVILSKNFVESVWSRLEFKAAHAQALSERSNRVILVVLEDDLNDKDVQDDDLRIYMKTNTYLKWNDPWFWHKLKYALPHRKSPIEDSDLSKKMHQRDRAIKLNKLRTKLEQTV